MLNIPTSSIDVCCCRCIADTAVSHCFALARLLVPEELNPYLCRAISQHMQEDTNRMSSTDSVSILRQILFKRLCIPCFNYVHAHLVQCLNRLVYGAAFLVIVRVMEPRTPVTKI
ncbi:hypothetical protein OIU77_031441 [Salix suchowensis]|uniref:Uncharacterized protein n=1 Tax=Salix suchowensis TaxID=1278906 RepID=A0ABQ9BFT9_9ROSI|nr:hypothetical protein OIU77_031441 [Salix suchowensis]